MISGTYKVFERKTGLSPELVGEFVIQDDAIVSTSGLADDLPKGRLADLPYLSFLTMDNGYYFVVPPEAPALNKSLETLAKGAVRKLYGKFNPRAEEYKPVKQELNEWQTYGGLMNERGQGMGEASQTPNERARAFNKLAAATSMRRNANTGEREFLLHRGVSPYERERTLLGNEVLNEKMSSWTPHHEVAKEFASDYSEIPGNDREEIIAKNPEHIKNHVFTAWIPESKIKGIPNQLGGQNKYKREHEVIVHPHTSQLVEYKPQPSSFPDVRLNERRKAKTN